MSASKPRLCVVGSIVMDLVVHAPRFPAPGETVLGGPFSPHPGGKGANQAIGAARLGAEVSMVGCVGDDVFGSGWKELFAAEGVDTTHLHVRRDVPTGVGCITIDRSGQNAIVVASGANATLSPADADAAAEVIGAADMLLLQLEIPAGTVVRAATIARSREVPVLLNAAPAGDLPGGLADLTDLIVVNETEAACLAGQRLGRGEASLEVFAHLAEKLGDLGIPAVFLTAGREGALYLRGGQPVAVPSVPVRPVDTVGAGDAFTAALAVAWIELELHRTPGASDPLAARAVHRACAAGAHAVTVRGAVPSLPDRAAVEAMLERHRRVTSGDA